MSYISPLLPAPPHMHMDARLHTHAGLFLGHLASSAELPAEILVQTEVLPLSRNSNADALEAALTAVKCSTINRKKSTQFDLFLFKVDHSHEMFLYFTVKSQNRLLY